MGRPKVCRGATKANNVALVAEMVPFGVAAVLIHHQFTRLLYLLLHRPLPLLPLPLPFLLSPPPTASPPTSDSNGYCSWS